MTHGFLNLNLVHVLSASSLRQCFVSRGIYWRTPCDALYVIISLSRIVLMSECYVLLSVITKIKGGAITFCHDWIERINKFVSE